MPINLIRSLEHCAVALGWRSSAIRYHVMCTYRDCIPWPHNVLVYMYIHVYVLVLYMYIRVGSKAIWRSSTLTEMLNNYMYVATTCLW